MHQLARFLEQVQARIESAASDPCFRADQRELLLSTVRQYRPHTKKSPLDEPIALVYLITQAWGRALDEQVERVAAFCSLYLLAADLLDDVQDSDLAGKPHAEAGSAVASNNAVALLFLALRELHAALALEACTERRAAFLQLVDRISLLVVSGQHRDLTVSARVEAKSEVLETQMAKTASVALVIECAALLARCGDVATAAYRKLGSHLAGVVQLRDDLRDVFGKGDSPDLRGDKPTYPMACFFERASAHDRARLEQLVGELPQSLGALRQLLYDSGAVAETVEAIEQNRRVVHEQIAMTGNDHAAHRTLLDVTDTAAGSVYRVPRLSSSAHLWRPEGAWHRAVRGEQGVFVERLEALGVPTPPTLVPWHATQWMYVPERDAIFYPDLEQQADDCLPFQAELLGITDLAQVSRLMREQLPAVLAHEMFHFWRAASGRLTQDHWHEEWVANRCAVAYLARFDPERLDSSVRLAEGTLARFPEALDAHAEAVLSRSALPSPHSRGYGMGLQQMALVGLEMVRRFADESLVLEEVAAALLAPARGNNERAA